MKNYLLIGLMLFLTPCLLQSQNTQLNYLKMNGDKVELRRENGFYLRLITEDAVTAQLNTGGDLVVVTKTNGNVELRRENGFYVCKITDDAKDARFLGDDILITKNDGCMELRKQNGFYIRKM